MGKRFSRRHCRKEGHPTIRNLVPVHALALTGRSIRGIAYRLTLDRKTVRRTLRQTHSELYHRAPVVAAGAV